MAYDPTLPANGSPVSSAELRSQLTGLKALIDQRPTVDDVILSIQQNSSARSNAVQYLGFSVSDPPTAVEVQSIVDKIDELIQQLRR